MALVLAVPALAAEPLAESGSDTKPKLESSLSSEPVQCYRLIAYIEIEVPIGQAVELCAGTLDSFKTVKCFQEAYGHPDDDGLGLPLGLAVDLCRTISRE
jgi:hypothetical protein